MTPSHVTQVGYTGQKETQVANGRHFGKSIEYISLYIIYYIRTFFDICASVAIEEGILMNT